MLLDICRDFLAAVTVNNYVRVFKVAGREAKPHAGPGERASIKVESLGWRWGLREMGP